MTKDFEGSVPSQSGAAPIAFVGGTILDGNGGIPIVDGVILIEGKRIVAVGNRSTPIPSNAKVIAASGKYITPGLMDSHVWLVTEYQVETMVRFEGRYDELAIEAAQIALKNGFTTVFDLWGPRDDLIKARDAINQGRFTGSRIYLGGAIAGYTGPYGEGFLDVGASVTDNFVTRINSKFTTNIGIELTWMSHDRVRAEIRNYLEANVDFLTVGITSHSGSAQRYLIFCPRILEAIIEEAHSVHRPVVGFHALSVEAFDYASKSGVDLLAAGCATNGQPIPIETISQIAQQQFPCTISPLSSEDLGWYGRQQLTNCDEYLKSSTISNTNSEALIRAEAQILLATGGGVYTKDFLTTSYRKKWVPPSELMTLLGEGYIYWLRTAQELGMKPMAALMAATRNIARAYRVDKDLGTLEAGKLADLIIFDKDPLANVDHYRSINLVMKDGDIVDRNGLPTRRLLTADAHAMAAPKSISAM